MDPHARTSGVGVGGGVGEGVGAGVGAGVGGAGVGLGVGLGVGHLVKSQVERLDVETQLASVQDVFPTVLHVWSVIHQTHEAMPHVCVMHVAHVPAASGSRTSRRAVRKAPIGQWRVCGSLVSCRQKESSAQQQKSVLSLAP